MIKFLPLLGDERNEPFSILPWDRLKKDGVVSAFSGSLSTSPDYCQRIFHVREEKGKESESRDHQHNAGF